MVKCNEEKRSSIRKIYCKTKGNRLKPRPTPKWKGQVIAVINDMGIDKWQKTKKKKWRKSKKQKGATTCNIEIMDRSDHVLH